MKLIVNKKEMEFCEEHISVNALLSSLEIGDKGVAIARGLSVIPRSEWGNPILKDGDEVTLIRATQGG